jgi:hypothetical protein
LKGYATISDGHLCMVDNYSIPSIIDSDDNMSVFYYSETYPEDMTIREYLIYLYGERLYILDEEDDWRQINHHISRLYKLKEYMKICDITEEECEEEWQHLQIPTKISLYI